MKILQIIQFLSPTKGGSVVIPYNLSIKLVEKGNEVMILTTDHYLDKNYLNTLKEKGIEVTVLKVKISIGGFLYTPAIKKWMKNNIQNFDIIHLHNYRTYQNIHSSKFGKKYKIPIIMNAHGSILRIAGRKLIKYIFDFVWGYTILKKCDKFIAVSKVEIKQYEKFLAKYVLTSYDISEIPNGVEVNELAILDDIGKNKKNNNLIEILYVGRIHKRKGILFLLEAFQKFHKDVSNSKLTIIGPDDGYLKNVINYINKNKLKEKITIFGFVNEKEKIQSYQKANILVYPAVDEIFGLVPFEAILNGTPVIVCSDSGSGELIEENKAGIVIEYNNVEELYLSMKKLAFDENLKNLYVHNGRKFIEEKLNWELVSNLYLAEYSNMINRN